MKSKCDTVVVSIPTIIMFIAKLAQVFADGFPICRLPTDACLHVHGSMFYRPKIYVEKRR